MDINTVINGFKIVNIRELPDVKGTLFEMKHEKTGAQLAWLKREDDNKTFSIAFKTIPEDDTGVFHMLEHSVLNGSEKYPVREPFVELLKGSMQTFLNALTYPDKTMYPVSSRNKKDFMNLMSVYMDAVFHPAIYHNPNIFRQEGWHYEIRNKEDEPVYKGVVLNEMKGAFSSVDEVIINELNRMLFPDNCYRFVSGGDPEHITDLSYEKFIETHQKFYHPSNARVWLDGDLDIDEVTKFINDEYFSHYEAEDMDFSIPMQEEKQPLHHEIPYELNPEEDPAARTQVAFARVVSSFDAPLKNLAWQALSTLLVSSNESILKKNIIEKDLGEDVELDIYDGIQQPWIVMCIRNTEKEKYDAIVDTLKESAETLIHGGLDHEQVIATLNQMEFRYREKHEPAGVMFAQRALETWLYDGDIAQGFSLGNVFEELRKKTEEGYFETLISEFFLEDAWSSLVAIPSTTLGEERVQKESEKLQKAKASWGDDIEKYIEENKILDAWQASSDTEEQIRTLPKLQLSDISEEPIEYAYEVKRCHGADVILHPAEDTGIVYLNFYFNLAGITRERLPYVSLFASLLTNLPTKSHTVEQLQSLIRKDLGSLGFFVDAYSVENAHDTCLPVLGCTVSVLKQNVDKVIPLVLEIMNETVFDPQKILPILKQDNDEFRQEISAMGHSFAMKRASAHCSAEGVFREFTSGYASGLFEKELEKNFAEKIGEFVNECELDQQVLFSKARLVASITGEENLHVVEELVDGLNDVEAIQAKMHYPLLEDQKEFISIPGGVNYSGIAYNTGDQLPADWNVLSHYLTYGYLWNEVRVKGGAYGTGFTSNANGNVGAYSFRDPDVLNALRAFASTGECVEQLKDSGADMTQMIIGSIAGCEPLLAPSAKVRVADRQYFTHLTYEQRKENRRCMIDATAEKLGSYCEVLKKAMQESAVCVIGNEDTYQKLEGFKKLETV